MEKLKSNFIDQLRSAFKNSFYFAVKGVFEHGFDSSWVSKKVHKPVCDLISNFRENTRCIVVLPRAWLKTTLCSTYYPLWRAMPDENFTSMIIQNTFTNAASKMRATGAILRNNQILRQMYPERMPDSSCKVSEEAICLPRRAPLSDPTFEAAGVGTQVTSRHIRLIVEDDTVAPEKSHMTGVMMLPTKAAIEQAIGFHKVAHLLLSDFKTDQRLIVGTPWVERDLISNVLENEPKYKIIRRAAREDANGKASSTGRLVYPERFDDEVLTEIRSIIGEYMFEAMMMSNPMAQSLMVFKPEHIRYFDVEPDGLITFQTVDPAPSDKESSDPDFNVAMTCGLDVKTGRAYVLERFRERCNPGQLIEAIINQGVKYNPVVIGVESVAYQSTLRYWLNEAMVKRNKFFNIEKVQTSRIKKELKIYGLQPLFEAGRIFIRPYMEDLRSELLAFPKGAHDDLPDCLSMQLEFWNQTELQFEDAKREESSLDPLSADCLLDELYARSKASGGFPNDVLSLNPHDTYGDRYSNVG